MNKPFENEMKFILVIKSKNLMKVEIENLAAVARTA